MSSRIEQIIDEMEQYIGGCRQQPLSKVNIIVNRDEISELLTELRLKTPDEIKRYQKIINNKDAILADAQAKADSILAAATIHTNELINEHEIMQKAYEQANEIVMMATNQAQEILDNATNDANNIRMASIQYTDEMLASLQNIVSHSMNNFSSKYEGLMSAMQNSMDVVAANRAELNQSEETASASDAGNEADEDFELD
ncbi:ATPase [Anaerobium acetethylicum]|uniref:ATPase n=1 Tax=Anaerobium acetethylicum TaxID=1619234 RepID=A0A1D3TNS5_9FIRM|nr:ATPase [Anaerobium acetethylicum]SCP94961.1 hypothetical protein SAMN05421730_1001198 [Anaerobium acetethylicum]